MPQVSVEVYNPDMTPASPTALKSLTTNLYILAGIGCLSAYWGFTAGPWPPPLLLLGTAIAGVMLAAVVALVLNERRPWTHRILLIGNILAAGWGIFFEYALYFRKGFDLALIYPFGLIVLAVLANPWYLAKPEVKELFGIARPKSSDEPEPEDLVP